LTRFVGALERHRFLSIAAQDPDLPADVRRHAATRHADVASLAERVVCEQDEILAMLAGSLSCDWLAVNGADYRTRLYPSAMLRPMSDVDILVRPSDVPEAVRALTGRGFAPMSRSSAAIDRGFQRPGSELWVDVYDSFAQRQRTDVDYDEIWRGRLVGMDRLPRMAPHHALAVHALRIANEQFVTPLRRFLDLWLLSRDETIVRQAIDAARRWRIVRAVFSTMVVLRGILPESAADPWHAEVNDLVRGRERARLERRILKGAPFDTLPSRPVQIWRKLTLLDTPAHRVRFVASHLAVLTRRVVDRGAHARP